MSWNQVTVISKQDQAEQVSDYLNELGALAITLKEGGDDRVFEPLPGETPLWSETHVVGLFDDELDINLVVNLLKSKYAEQIVIQEIERIEDQDWERAWLDDFQPMQFGEKLWIVPSSYEPVDPEAINIVLDPGLAFGTGTHATTAMCLKWLDANEISGKSVIDYGCGSGILAIAAAKLGAKEIDAIDVDPQALVATEANARVNQVEKQINTFLPDQFKEKAVDILLANILAKPLISFAKSFSGLLNPGGKLVLSGILTEQADKVLQAYEPWFDVEVAENREDWILITGTKK